MKLSQIGKKFSEQAGILSLMDDLGHALASNDELIMMGGGNPSYIPEVENLVRQRLRIALEQPKALHQWIGVYDPPQGNRQFLKALANLLKNACGWNITERNIMLTNGSQSGFFMLFNLLAGTHESGVNQKIQFPLTPEYIGYSDLGLTNHFFTATAPKIEMIEEHLFKYHVDFNHLNIDQNTAALCISRPTNPTGNVISDDELQRLSDLAKQRNMPLIIDSAYGTPFPNLIYTQATPLWDEHIIVCMSLSKLGLPAARTGIIIANEPLIHALTNMNAILNLATGSTGSFLTQSIVDSGEILTLSKSVIHPFYEQKKNRAVAAIKNAFMNHPAQWALHKPEGAMFLWLWFKDLPISSLALYQRLKQRGVLVVSGHYFFPGLTEQNTHTQECIRLTYSQDDTTVERGIQIIADEVKSLYP